MYILVTPAKNEHLNLPTVAYFVAKQTIRPLLWFIVDDGSTDATPEIINDLEKEHSWIKSIRLPPRSRDITIVAYVYKVGLDKAIELCEKENIEYEYIASLDADTVLETDYFEKLIDEMKADPRLGISSGGVYQDINGELEWRKTSEKLPTGTGRIWTKECFFDTGGYPVEPAQDSLSNAKAAIRGWDTRQFKDIVAVQTRLTSSAQGLWKGYKTNGFLAYYVNKHPFLVMVNAISLVFREPFYLFIPFTYGYLSSWIKRKKRTEDEEIREYFWNGRMREYRHMLMKKLKVHDAKQKGSAQR